MLRTELVLGALERYSAVNCNFSQISRCSDYAFAMINESGSALSRQRTQSRALLKGPRLYQLDVHLCAVSASYPGPSLKLFSNHLIFLP